MYKINNHFLEDLSVDTPSKRKHKSCNYGKYTYTCLEALTKPKPRIPVQCPYTLCLVLGKVLDKIEQYYIIYVK